MKHQIEAEIRGSILVEQFPRVKRLLGSLGFRYAESTRRTSVMSFGEAHARAKGWNLHRKNEIDVRCRITNGRAEVVAKVGSLHGANRREVPIAVSVDDMCRFACLFSALGLYTKVGSRSSDEFVRGSIHVSLVWSPKQTAYFEIEKMSTPAREVADIQELYKVAAELGLKPYKTRSAYAVLCEKLTREDWEFFGTDADVRRLQKEIVRIGSGRRSRRT